jgi:hypothetical protein
VIAAALSIALWAGCGSNTTTTIETVVTQLPSTAAVPAPLGQTGTTEPTATTTAAAAGQAKAGETVPNELELRLIVAEEDLESRGLAYKVVKVEGRHRFGSVAKADWTVCEMRPPPGASIAKGTEIGLVIARFSRPRCKALRRGRHR